MTKFQLAPALMGIAEDMIRKGWQPVWCPARQTGSFSPLPGCTGSVEYPAILPQPNHMHKLAFRPPPDVLVLDVDDYDDKHGADTLERAESWLGELPMTYRVTSRGYSNLSGRYLYRIPADLIVMDSSLYQFADPETRCTDIEIVRTGHRFSWAPGDYHYKNDQLIQCWDEFGTLMDEMPDVDELPDLPEKWVAYFRNPPVPQKREAYTRPSDGAEWWLSQADNSLGTDAELSSFAYNMLLSRVPEEDIYTQWDRVSVALNPAHPWERSDFDRHIGARAQNKAAEILAHQDLETAYALNTPGPEGVIDAMLARQKAEFEKPRELHALIEPEIPVDEGASKELQALKPQPVEYKKKTRAEKAREIIKENPRYNDLFYRDAAKEVVARDVAELFSSEFGGFEDVSEFEDPDNPTLFQITGKNSPATCVVIEGTIVVLSAKRASGKTWTTALWAEQVMTAGGHVIWLDFERQPRGLAEKLRAVGVPKHIMKGQLHYSAVLPPVTELTSAIATYRATGKPVLFVVDAFRTLQGSVLPGSNANDGDAVEQVYIEYLTPAVEAGATVVLLDHIAKNGDGSTFGSERKESAADYVIRLEKTEPFSKTKPGFASLTCAKDRYGNFSEGDPLGYLWVPGDKSKSGKSIDQYPFIPSLRNWSPAELEEEAVIELSAKGQREAAITQVVTDHPLQYGSRELGRHVHEVYSELFVSPKAATDLANRMWKEGKLLKEEGKDGKYDVPVQVGNVTVTSQGQPSNMIKWMVGDGD